MCLHGAHVGFGNTLPIAREKCLGLRRRRGAEAAEGEAEAAEGAAKELADIEAANAAEAVAEARRVEEEEKAAATKAQKASRRASIVSITAMTEAQVPSPEPTVDEEAETPPLSSLAAEESAAEAPSVEVVVMDDPASSTAEESAPAAPEELPAAGMAAPLCETRRGCCGVVGLAPGARVACCLLRCGLQGPLQLSVAVTVTVA